MTDNPTSAIIDNKNNKYTGQYTDLHENQDHHDHCWAQISKYRKHLISMYLALYINIYRRLDQVIDTFPICYDMLPDVTTNTINMIDNDI